MKILWSILLVALPAFTQSTNATLSGTVVDATGARVPKVAVMAENVNTGIVLTTATNEAGVYGFASVQPGVYRITAETPDVPELLFAPARGSLTDDERSHYEERRLDYHTRLGVVATSTLRHVVNTGRRLALLNRHAVSARRGLIVSGAAGTGKTTAITQFGKTHETIDHRRHPGGDRIPVVYVTVPPAATQASTARFSAMPSTAWRTTALGMLAAAKPTASSASRRPFSWSRSMDAARPAMPIRPMTRPASCTR